MNKSIVFATISMVSCSCSCVLPALAQTPAASAAGTQLSSNDFGPVYQTIPFDLKDNHVVVELKIYPDGQDGGRSKTLHFLWDTGCTFTTLSKEALDGYKLGLIPSKSVADPGDAKGLGADAIHTSVYDARIRMGTMDAPLQLLVLPFGTDISDVGVDGAIGGNILERFVFEIDYENRKIRLYDPLTFKAPVPAEQFVRLPLSFNSSGIPVTDANVTPIGFSGSRVRLALDTGDDDSVILYGPFVRRVKWQDALGSNTSVIVAGAGGQSEQRSGRLNQLQFGGATLGNVPVVFAANAHGALADSDSDGQVGGEVFSRFTMIFDYRHKVLYLRPNNSAKQPFASTFTFGFIPSESADRTGGVEIASIKPGSAFAVAGVLVGDKILSIDRKSTLGITDMALSALIQESGKPRVFEIGRGSERLTMTIKPIAY